MQRSHASVRSASAPPLAHDINDDDGSLSPSDPRLDPSYYNYYYSQSPLDPRLPPPLYGWPGAPAHFNFASIHAPQPSRGARSDARLSAGDGVWSRHSPDDPWLRESTADAAAAEIAHSSVASALSLSDETRTRAPDDYADADDAPRRPRRHGNPNTGPNANPSPNPSPARAKRTGESPGPPRSALLEEFRGRSSARRWELPALAGHIAEFSADQHGSRFIQQKLETAAEKEKEAVFLEVQAAAPLLMTDVFGNYVVQKFFEFGAPSQVERLGALLRGQVVSLSLQMYGCRVIQKALEVVPSRLQEQIVRELEPGILRCVRDQNGNHVVQKVVERVEPRAIDSVVRTFTGEAVALSVHPYGCRVVQRVLEHCTDEQKAPLLRELLAELPRLVQDQYGNYVIQHILERGARSDRDRIIAQLRGNFFRLSLHKFSSNVVEKCVQHGTKEDREAIVRELLATRSEKGTPAILEMTKDQYANYVVQKILDVVDPQQRELLVRETRPYLAQLRKVAYAKHILSRLEGTHSGSPSPTTSSTSSPSSDRRKKGN